MFKRERNRKSIGRERNRNREWQIDRKRKGFNMFKRERDRKWNGEE